jgi:hypothetical protein
MLGVVLAILAAPAFSATIVIDQDFNATATYGSGQAPAGMAQATRNVSLSTVSEQNGYLSITNSSGNALPTIYRSLNTFANGSTTVITTTTDIRQTVGTTNITGFGAGLNNIGFSLEDDGTLHVSSLVSGISCGGRCYYDLPDPLKQVDGSAYSGGPVQITVRYSETGWNLTSNTGYDAALLVEGGSTDGWLDYGLMTVSGPDPAFSDFYGSANVGLLGLVNPGSADYGRFQVVTATGADSVTVNIATTQTTPVATTTLSIANSGSVDQTGGTTTVLQTMTVDAGGTYTLSGGTLDAGTIDVDGTFSFVGGTLSVDELQGDLTNTGGLLSPGNSPGLTAITGDYDQQIAGALLIELAGLNAVSEYDQVQVGGTATLGGTLDVDLLYGYVPVLGDSYDILLAEVVAGTFGTTLLPTLGPGLAWSLQYLVDAIGTTDVVRLSVQQAVPVPTAVWLFSSALAALGLAKRRTMPAV